MPIYQLYSGAYSKTSRSSWQYYRDKLALDNNNNNNIDFPANNNSSFLFNFKLKITGQTKNGLLKYLSNFWRTL